MLFDLMVGGMTWRQSAALAVDLESRGASGMLFTEGGQVPTQEPPAWQPLNGRLYNSYRSQPRSTADIAAPDLTITAVQITSATARAGHGARHREGARRGVRCPGRADHRR